MSGTSGLPKGDNPGNATDPYGNPTGVTPTNPGIVPTTAPTTRYSAGSPYTSPTFAYTPYTGYAGLAQQLYAALNPSLKAYTSAPRTDITDMAYAPWASLYGGPATTPLPGSLPTTPPPPPVTTVPPAGGPPPGAPPPAGGPPPPAGGPPPPGSPPPTTVPGARYPGGGGAPGTKSFGAHNGGGFAQWMADPTGTNMGEYTNTTPTGDAPGGLLNAMRAAGLNNAGAGSLLMASGLNSSNMRLGNGPLTYEQQIQGLRQGVNNRDLGRLRFSGGKWMDGNAPYVSPGNTFTGWVGRGKRG